jgi:hypothetical protein
LVPLKTNYGLSLLSGGNALFMKTPGASRVTLISNTHVL